MQMDEATFEMVRHAVRMARDQQVGTVERLRAKLLEDHPGNEGVIDQALLVWARHEAEAARAS
jgi:hypothetical protein